jgi:peptidoglycan/xylan/chitin deacetylase (PgdA/CDA1 family)
MANEKLHVDEVGQRAKNSTPLFVVSLDVELNWGVRDTKRHGSYDENILGEREATRVTLDIFDEFGIHATWAIVGFLFFDHKKQLIENLPGERPRYANESFCPYSGLHAVGETEAADPYHLGASLVRMIEGRANQEIATHTFSHFYCLEEGQDAASFAADLDAAVNAARRRNLAIDSIVFPRHQVNPAYLEICRRAGIRAYRGTERHWLYTPRKLADETLLRRCLRVLDGYVNISGHHTVLPVPPVPGLPVNVAHSRFLRPYSRKLAMLEPLRLRRILRGLDHAARRGEMFHLWWHPHNFGVNLDENLAFLRRILEHVRLLQRQYGMRSLNMREVAALCDPVDVVTTASATIAA